MSENGVFWFRAGRSVFLCVIWRPRITCQSWRIDDEFNPFFREHFWGDSNDRYPKAAQLLELKINLSILVMNCHWCKGWALHLCFHNIKIGVFQLKKMIHARASDTNLRIILSSRFHSKSHQSSRTRPLWVPPAWAPPWRRWPRRSGGIRPQQRWRASVPRKVVFPDVRGGFRTVWFSKCCWKRYCCYLFIYWFIYSLIYLFIH